MFKTTLEELKEIDYLISYCADLQDDFWKLYESKSITKEELDDKWSYYSDLKKQLYVKKNVRVSSLFSKWDIKL